MGKLTDKEKLFIKYYLKTRNGTEAAKLAGYSEKTACSIASENLRKPHIQRAIHRQLKKHFEKLDVSTERILLELARIAFADIKDISHWTESGVYFFESNEIGPMTSSAISEVSESRTSGQDGDLTFSNIKLRMHDKVRALELLGKYQKLFTNKHEHTGADGKPLIPNSFVDLVKRVALNKK